jgi:monothiol glutaredoxin
MAEALKESIEQQLKANKIVVFGKGTKEAPRCGFTLETIEFFNGMGYPFEVIDVLADNDKRQALSEMTNWPTLPKVFIDGKFYGDTDVLEPMRESGELQALLEKAFKDQS